MKQLKWRQWYTLVCFLLIISMLIARCQIQRRMAEELALHDAWVKGFRCGTGQECLHPDGTPVRSFR